MKDQSGSLHLWKKNPKLRIEGQNPDKTRNHLRSMKFRGSSKKNMEENTIDTTDRISMLPDSIVHHILSYLWGYPESSVRMSVLSKEWFALTASNPFLFLHGNDARGFSLCKYVEYTVSRFCEQNISAHTLKISVDLLNIEEIDLLERYVDLIIEKGLQMIEIELGYSRPCLPKFQLPNSLLSASWLTSLILENCELPSSLMVNDVKLKSLRLLSLSLLHLDEGVIEYLTKGCPLLEEIYIGEFCNGFKTFCVKRHQNLIKVEIICRSGSELERIDVEAPNLSYFCFTSYTEKVPSMFLDSCKKLTTFYYRGYPLTRFSDFLSSFRFLKNVTLDVLSPVKNLKFSNHSLRNIHLPLNCDLDEIELNAPNLLFFEYSSRLGFPIFTPLSREDSYVSQGCMKCETNYDSDILLFKKLKRFLEKNSIFKVLKLGIHWELTNVEELKLIQSAPYKLEHVQLNSRIRNSHAYMAVLDVLLWCFCPRSLTIKLGCFINKSDAVKYAYEKLLQQEGEGQTNIKFVLISYSVPELPEKKFSDLNSLLKAVSSDGYLKKITFIMEEVVQEMEYANHDSRKITFIKEEVVQEIEYANSEISSSLGLRNVSVMTEEIEYVNSEISSSSGLRNVSVMPEVKKVSPVLLVDNWIMCFRVMITLLFVFTFVLMALKLL